ncbi:MAG: acyl carrier protein [Acutalibacteraceae bacterium]|nr:acyl carrier protein [Acutalibacteraceae bacterium]
MIFEKLKEIIAEQLEIDAETVTLETRLGEDLNADSLDIVEMLMALEDEFGVDIPDEEIEKMKTVGDVVSYIEINK